MSYLKIVGGVLIWAVINGFVIKNISHSVSPTVLGALMSLVGVVLYLPYLVFKAKVNLNSRQLKLLLCLGLAAALNNSFFYTALAITKIANAALVHYFASVIAIVWIAFVPAFKEKIDKASSISIALGVIGLFIMIGSGWLRHELWLYLALISAFFYSWEIVFSKQVSSSEVPAHLSSFTKLSFQLIIMPVMGLILGQSFKVPSNSYPAIIMAGLLLFISFILVFSGLKDRRISTKHFAVIGYFDRLGAIGIGYLWWGERFGWNVWLGGLLILIAEVPILFSKKE